MKMTERGDELRCPYLEVAAGGGSCAASPASRAPGADEAEEYCRSEEHSRCPTLLGYLLRGSRRGRSSVLAAR